MLQIPERIKLFYDRLLVDENVPRWLTEAAVFSFAQLHLGNPG